MSIRFLSIRALVPTAMVLSAMSLAVSPSYSQQPPTGSQQAQTPAGQNPGQVPAPTTAAAPPASNVPDYPDPRTIVFGVYGLYSFSSPGPNIIGGAASANADTYASLYRIGTPYRIIPEFEAGIPITRTGMLYVEFNRYHGWNNQTLTRDSFLDTYSFVAGDVVSSTYHVTAGRIYLDDLMFPHKFPVARLRFKSIWAFRYIGLSHTVDSPTEDAVAGLAGSSFQIGNNYVALPEFGAAMEYAVAPHVLFRVDGAGFVIPHHSDVSDASATLSVREKNLEFLMGAKMLHFKSSPQGTQYGEATFVTPFIGLRWHF